jgi:hypothetical protein
MVMHNRPVRSDKQGVPVGFGPGNVFAGNRATAAWLILNDDGHCKCIANAGLQDTRAHIHVSTGSVRNDQHDRS